MTEQVAIDGLYGLPLDEFTPARDALAARLREEGDKDAAARIKKLRKPSVGAWAVNQLAHRYPDEIEKLLAVRDDIESSRSAKEMRAASEARKRLIAVLVDRAGKMLSEAGHAASANTVQAITQTLHGGDTETEREELLHGRLTRELQPSGLGGFGVAFEDGPEEEEEPDPRLDEKRARLDELLQEAEGADREAAVAERAVGDAERALETARAKAEVARRSADQALKRVDRARRDLDPANK